MIPTAQEFLEMNRQKKDRVFRLGKVDSVSGGLPAILFDGEETASGKLYAKLSTYSPSTGDRVLLAKVSGTYIVLGKVVI